MPCCKAVSVCMHAAHPLNAFVWNAAACPLFVCYFTNYLQLPGLARPKPSLVYTQEPLPGRGRLQGRPQNAAGQSSLADGPRKLFQYQFSSTYLLNYNIAALNGQF